MPQRPTKAPLPDPLAFIARKYFSLLSTTDTYSDASIPRIRCDGSRKALQHQTILQVTAFPFLRCWGILNVRHRLERSDDSESSSTGSGSLVGRPTLLGGEPQRRSCDVVFQRAYSVDFDANEIVFQQSEAITRHDPGSCHQVHSGRKDVVLKQVVH